MIIALLIFGYIFGSFPTGYLYAKKRGIDIFNEGSKNPGSTNIKRVLGKKAGKTVFIIDLLKTLLPIFILLLINDFMFIIDYHYIILYTGLGAILGHNYPFTTKFKGGKGVTSTLAVIACYNLIYAVVLYAIYHIIKKTTKYVSLGSIMALFSIFLSSIVFYIFKLKHFDNILYIIPLIILSVLGILRHKENIKRLINGTENKIM